MQWIKEIETTKSIDDLVTPRSYLGRTDFPDHDTLDAMMASALRKLFDKQTHFRKRVIVDEQRAQNNDRFLRGRQIAFMIYEHFVQLDLMMEFEVYQICSVFDYTATTFKIFIYAGSKNFYQQVIHYRTTFWNVCTGRNYKTLLSFRPH